MAAPVRNATQIEHDRLFLLSVLRKGGRDVAATDLARILNSRRSAAERETALALGKTPEEAEAIGKLATLSVSTIKRDIRIVTKRLREATTAGAGALLDEQIEACAMDVESTYRLDEEILADLERSRRETKTITRGPLPPPAKEGEPPPKVQPAEIVRHTAETAARAELYNALSRNVKRRMELRSEMRLLRFGKEWFQADEETTISFTESLTGISDPGKAREVALDLFAKELGNLSRIEQLEIGPTPPEIARLQRLRLQRHVHRVRMIREFVDLAEGGSDGKKFEIRVLSASRNGRPKGG